MLLTPADSKRMPPWSLTLMLATVRRMPELPGWHRVAALVLGCLLVTLVLPFVLDRHPGGRFLDQWLVAYGSWYATLPVALLALPLGRWGALRVRVALRRSHAGARLAHRLGDALYRSGAYPGVGGTVVPAH